jgi:hypothetical protein
MDEIEAIRTRVAWTGWDDHRFFGHWVFGELMGNESYTGLLALAVTGRRMPREDCAMLDDLAGAVTIAEPRIWALKTARFVAAFGGTLSACCVANLCLEQSAIGPWTARSVAQSLVALRAALGNGPPDREDVRREVLALLAAKKRLVGFGVPFRPYDERLRALALCVGKRQRDRLPFWTLQGMVCDVLRRERGLEPNIGIGLAAVCLDLGLSPDEIAPLVVALMQHLIYANAVEGARQAPALLRRLPDGCIDYVGTPPRESARAIALRPARAASPDPRCS